MTQVRSPWRRTERSRRAVGWSAIATLLGAACGGKLADRDASTTYVADATDGDDAVAVALVVRGDQVTAYACADDPAREPYHGWFTGQVAPDGSIRIARDGWTFTASSSVASASGTIVAPSGAKLHWSGARAGASRLTGLYATSDSGCTTGVIVIDEDPTKPPTVRGAWCSAQGEVLQVTPILPVELVDHRLAVQVPSAAGARLLYVAPLVAVSP